MKKRVKQALSLILVFGLCLSLGAISLAADDDSLTKAMGKQPGDGNPLYTQRFGADPCALEYNGRLYVYMTNDVLSFTSTGKAAENTYGSIVHINVISSDDLINWTDHGSIPVAGKNGIAKWASNSWAPSVVYKNIDGKDKFFLYFANSGNGVGVLAGDSPVGPWSDPLGKNLVDHKTPNCESKVVPWCFDPAAFIDDDGKAYLYFGGGTDGLNSANPKSARVVQLGDDMLSIVGTPQEIDAPYFFEAAYMNKIGGKYYFTYSSNWDSSKSIAGEKPGQCQIGYMMGDSPMGPFTYIDTILPNPGAIRGFVNYYNNNHQSIVEFKGKLYLLYHATLVASDMGYNKNYRSTHINELTVGNDGKLEPVTGDRKGVEQVKNLDVSGIVEAETIAWNGGIATVMQDGTMKTTANMYVTDINNGDWIAVSKADFGTDGVFSFAACAAGQKGGTIELHLNSADGPVFGTLNIAANDGASWQVTKTEVIAVTGVRDVYLVFKGDADAELFKLDWWSFDSDVKADTFSDTRNHWAAESIEFAARRGLFSGTGNGKFSPNANMTRAMFITVLARLDGSILSEYGNPRFSDVPAGEWYSNAVEWAAAKGIVDGDSANFNPNDDITRQDLSLMLYNYAVLKWYNIPEDSGEAFADAASIDAGALEAVMAMRALGVVNGKPGNLYDPQGKATRAEIATIFMRFMSAYGLS